MKPALLILALLLAGCTEYDPNAPTFRFDAVSPHEGTRYGLRIFEFTPQTATHMKCVYVSGDGGGLSCFPKK